MSLDSIFRIGSTQRTPSHSQRSQRRCREIRPFASSAGFALRTFRIGLNAKNTKAIAKFTKTQPRDSSSLRTLRASLCVLCVFGRSKTQCLLLSLSALALTQRTQRYFAKIARRRRREYSDPLRTLRPSLRDLCVSCRSKTQCLVFSLSALALTQRTQRSSQRRRREYSARVQPSRLRRSQIFIALDRQRHLGGGLPPTSLCRVFHTLPKKSIHRRAINIPLLTELKAASSDARVPRSFPGQKLPAKARQIKLSKINQPQAEYSSVPAIGSTLCTNCMKMHKMHKLIQNAQNGQNAQTEQCP